MPAEAAGAGVEAAQELVETGAAEAALGEQTMAQQQGVGDELVDEHGRLHARVAVSDEHLLTQAVEGAGDDLVDVQAAGRVALRGAEALVGLDRLEHPKAPVQDSRPQFGGSLGGEGGGDDAVGGDVIDEQQFEDASGQARGLAGSRAGDQVERGIGRGPQRVELLGVGGESERLFMAAQKFVKGEHRVVPPG